MTTETYELQPEFIETFKDVTREELLQYIKRLQQTVNGLTEGMGIMQNELAAAYSVMTDIEDDNLMLQETVNILVDATEVVINFVDEWKGTYYPNGSRQRTVQIVVEDFANRLEPHFIDINVPDEETTP